MNRRAPQVLMDLLAPRAVLILAQLALVSAYLLGGVVKLLDFPAAVAEQAHFGVPFPSAAAGLTIGVELIGPALVLSGRWRWLGAGMLGVFTGFAAIVANGFWALHGADRTMAANAFFEHIGLIGGFVLIAWIDVRRP